MRKQAIILCAGIVVILTSCGPGQALGPTVTPSPIITQTPTNTPIPTSTPTETPDPCLLLSLELVEKSEDLVYEWQDAFNLAMSTPKINLAPQIQELQRIKREYGKILLPDECADYVLGFYEDLYLSMEETIMGFTAFLADSPEKEIEEHFTKATELLSKYE